MKYSLERLTASEPKWNFALVFIANSDMPLPVHARQGSVRWLRDEEVLIVMVPRVQDPLNPGSEGGMGPEGPVPGRPAGVAELESHVHIDSITAINFYTQLVPVTKSTEKSTILDAEGENPEVAKKREELHKKKETSKEKPENPLKKA